jgi:tripartite-type tricarboxylate transporter receptor subunit TctC
MNKLLRQGATLVASAILSFTAVSAIAADAYPSHAITLIVPFAAGGGTDIIARDLARTLSDQVGQSVIVDNRGGGGGVIGATATKNARPDGYTLLFVTSTFVTNAVFENTTA